MLLIFMCLCVAAIILDRLATANDQLDHDLAVLHADDDTRD